MTQIINIYKNVNVNEKQNEKNMYGNVQTMTSLEIAELTGKQHKNVMQAIRNMEPAWEKVTGLKFQLCEKSYLLANGVTKKQPFYQLTKTECLYIATKFNDETRAKLVLRWQELELQEQKRRQQLCLPEPKEILRLADEIIGEGLRMLNEEAEDTLTATQVAKTFNMKVYDFNAVLRDMGIQYRRGGRWNISIFERLDIQFTFEQAMQQSVAVKGANVNHNTVRQMLKNWRKQGLVVLEEDGNYRKL